MHDDCTAAVDVVQEGVDDVVTSRTLRRAARTGYAELIASLVGDLPVWMVTITHKKQSTHPEFSVKARSRWMHRLNRDVFGSRYDRRGEGLLSFFGIEFQKRGTVHQHGIVAGEGLDSVSRDLQSGNLTGLAQGWCKVELPRHKVRAVKYCSKYVSKDGELDIWLPRAMLFDRA